MQATKNNINYFRITKYNTQKPTTFWFLVSDCDCQLNRWSSVAPRHRWKLMCLCFHETEPCSSSARIPGGKSWLNLLSRWLKHVLSHVVLNSLKCNDGKKNTACLWWWKCAKHLNYWKLGWGAAGHGCVVCVTFWLIYVRVCLPPVLATQHDMYVDIMKNYFLSK